MIETLYIFWLICIICCIKILVDKQYETGDPDNTLYHIFITFWVALLAPLFLIVLLIMKYKK